MATIPNQFSFPKDKKLGILPFSIPYKKFFRKHLIKCTNYGIIDKQLQDDRSMSGNVSIFRNIYKTLIKSVLTTIKTIKYSVQQKYIIIIKEDTSICFPKVRLLTRLTF